MTEHLRSSISVSSVRRVKVYKWGYKLNISIESDVVDDRLEKSVNEAQRELQMQAAAYVEVKLRIHLLEKLTKGMQANLRWMSLLKN